MKLLNATTREKNPNDNMIKDDFQLFNNLLIVESNGSQQDWKYIFEPLNGTKYLIYCDISLFCFLLNLDPKYQRDLKKKNLC